MTTLSLLDDLEAFIREHHPDLATERTGEGSTLRISEQGRSEEKGRPVVHLQAGREALVLDWTWRLPLKDGKTETLRTLVLDYVLDGIENHGWEVPLLLEGGPLAGRRLTKPRRDLVGRLLFARKGEEADEGPSAQIYKWHLQKNEAGEYVCRYERTLLGDEVDAFIARGADKAGNFVLIHDRD